MSIKVTGLTASNVQALREANDAGRGVKLSQIMYTYVVFDASTAADALEQIQADMDYVRANSAAVRTTRYQSLIAVRNKLRAAAVTSHHHVQEV